MQTFLPYNNLQRSAECLDYRRLGKQRVECKQILKNLIGKPDRWNNHPAVKMWQGHPKSLAVYMFYCIEEWIKRGYKNNMEIPIIEGPLTYPKWFGNSKFHDSHKAALLFKDPEWYGQFDWNVKPKIEYWWPK